MLSRYPTCAPRPETPLRLLAFVRDRTTLASMSLRVEWDPLKAEANEAKHGVTFSEAASVFADPLSVTLPDPDHSADEERLLLLGQSGSGRFLIVSLTEREMTVRIISARAMTRKERRTYERATRR